MKKSKAKAIKKLLGNIRSNGVKALIVLRCLFEVTNCLKRFTSTQFSVVKLHLIQALEEGHNLSAAPLAGGSYFGLYSIPTNPQGTIQKIRFIDQFNRSLTLKIWYAWYVHNGFVFATTKHNSNNLISNWVLLKKEKETPPTFRVIQNTEHTSERGLRWARFQILEIGDNLEDRLVILCKHDFQLYRFDKGREKLISYGIQGYFSHIEEKVQIERPIFMKSDDGIFVVAADGYQYDKDDENSGYRLGTYRLNFRDEGDGYGEIESIEYNSDNRKPFTAVRFVINHGIKYKKINTKEENEYASYFYYQKNSFINVEKMVNGSLSGVFSLSLALGRYALDLRAIPETTFCAYFSSTHFFRDGNEWDSSAMSYNISIYTHRLSREDIHRSKLVNYHNEIFDYPLADDFIILKNLNYVFVGFFTEYKNLRRGDNFLDLCEDPSQIADGRKDQLTCSPTWEVLEAEILEGCERVLPIALSCLECKKRYKLVKKLGPKGDEFPFTKYCESMCSPPTYYNETYDGCYDCSKMFPGCVECQDGEEVCLKCKEGLHLKGGVCFNCIANCSKCSSSTVCFTCKEGYEKIIYERKTLCLAECKEDEFREGLECVNCNTEENPECLECDSKSLECSECKPMFKLNQDNICVDDGVRCLSNQYRTGNQEIPCKNCSTQENSSCNRCFDLTGECSGCEFGYELTESKFCRRKCRQDEFYEGKKKNTCQSCSVKNQNCVECSDESGRCSKCRDLFSLNIQGECREKCEGLDFCEVCNPQAKRCESCKLGYQPDGQGFCRRECSTGSAWNGKKNNTCVECSAKVPGCMECEDITSKCTRCGDRMQIINNGSLCVPICEEGNFMTLVDEGRKGVCKKCSGFRFNGDGCSVCSDITGECLGCSDGYTMTYDKFCEKECSDRRVWSGRDENRCLSCPVNCKVCSKIENQCSECESGYKVSEDKTNCTVYLPQKTSHQKKNLSWL